MPAAKELDKAFEDFMEEKQFNAAAREKMRLMPTATKWLLLCQETNKAKTEQSPSFFAKMLGANVMDDAMRRPSSASISGRDAPRQSSLAPGSPPQPGGTPVTAAGTGGPPKVEELKVQEVKVNPKDLQNLRVVLGSQGKSWMSEFVAEGALGALLNLLSREAQVEITREVLGCLKAFMNNEYGLNVILSMPAAVEQLAITLLYGTDEMRIQVLDLLTVVCWISEQGHKYVATFHLCITCSYLLCAHHLSMVYRSVMDALKNARFQRRFQVMIDIMAARENVICIVCYHFLLTTGDALSDAIDCWRVPL
jgi:hypothetical protein